MKSHQKGRQKLYRHLAKYIASLAEKYGEELIPHAEERADAVLEKVHSFQGNELACIDWILEPRKRCDPLGVIQTFFASVSYTQLLRALKHYIPSAMREMCMNIDDIKYAVFCYNLYHIATKLSSERAIHFIAGLGYAANDHSNFSSMYGTQFNENNNYAISLLELPQKLMRTYFLLWSFINTKNHKRKRNNENIDDERCSKKAKK